MSNLTKTKKLTSFTYMLTIIIGFSLGLTATTVIPFIESQFESDHELTYEETEKGIEYAPNVWLKLDGCTLNREDLILSSHVEITNERHYDIFVTWSMNDNIETVIVPSNSIALDKSIESKGTQCKSKILEVQRR